MHAPPNVDQLRELAKDAAAAAPITSTIANSFLTALGRLAAKTPGMKADPDEDDATLRSWMFRQADIIRTMAAQAVEAARWQIILEHAVSLRNWNQVVFDNPFVPPGRELFFARGPHAGLTGDFVVAAHRLIPQIENSSRRVLEARGSHRIDI